MICAKDVEARWWRLEVAGIPQAKPRVKATRRGAYTGVYTPGGAWKAWEQALFLGCGGAPTPAHDGPVSLRIVYRMPRPKSMPAHLRAEGIFCWRKPDVDNLEKLALDVLKRRGWFTDDGRVAEVYQKKVYSDRPGIEITVRHLQEGDGVNG